MDKKVIIRIGVLFGLGIIFIILNHLNLGQKKPDSVAVKKDDNLTEITNDAAFNEKKYELNSEEYYKDLSRFLTMHLQSLVSNDEPAFFTSELPQEELAYLTNALLAGDGQDVCYNQDYFKDKVAKYFGMDFGRFNKNSLYYTLTDKQVCFDAIWLNARPEAEILSYYTQSNYIIVMTSYEGRNYILSYEKYNDSDAYLFHFEYINPES